MAEVSGIEPETTESKSVVLPITPHPNKNNRIVVDCFQYTQAITLSLLVLFQQLTSTSSGEPLNSINLSQCLTSHIICICCCTDPKTGAAGRIRTSITSLEWNFYVAVCTLVRVTFLSVLANQTTAALIWLHLLDSNQPLPVNSRGYSPRILRWNKNWSPYQDSNLDLTAPNGKCNQITLYRDKFGGTLNNAV